MICTEKTRVKFLIDQENIGEETLITQGKKEKQESYNLEVSKQKMDQIREENQRLKLRLSQVMEDYHSLKMQFNEEDYNQPKKSTDLVAPENDESEFVSLSLGRSCNNSNTEEKKEKKGSSSVYDEGKNPNDGLELGLDCKFHSDNSTDETLSKNESDEKGNNEATAECHKGSPKNSRSGDDEILQDSPSLKKPRVSVRAFCNTQTMNDGCQWRKYGQKIAKGNPCPRAYYRCTVSSSCPVQRCADDMSILTTTYEGTHNHPLPAAATSMASTTSAAAAMLNCTSSSSSTSSNGNSTAGSGFNFTSANNLGTSRFPNITISSTQSHPTVVLDLTAPNHYSSHNNKLFSSGLFSSALSTPTFLNFSTTSNSWFDQNSAFVKNITSSYSQPFVFNNNVMASSRHAANHEEKSIAAATMAITSNPGFQSALAAAITSFVGNKVQGRNNSGVDFQLSFSQSSDLKQHWEHRNDKLL